MPYIPVFVKRHHIIATLLTEQQNGSRCQGECYEQSLSSIKIIYHYYYNFNEINVNAIPLNNQYLKILLMHKYCLKSANGHKWK